MDDIVLIGYGGHAKSLADCILRAGQYHVVGYTDIAESDSRYKYLGSDNELKQLYKNGFRMAALGIGFMGNSYLRDSLVEYVKDIGFTLPPIIDPSAIVAVGAEIGEGTFIGKNVIINADSKIGKYCIINTGTIIEHESIVGDFSHIAVSAVLCGNVEIGHHSLIGASATVIQGLKIGNNCTVGANSTVLSNVGDNMKVYGIVISKEI